MATDDFIKTERDWQREQARDAREEQEDKRRAWTARIGYISIATVVIAVVVSVCLLIWKVNADNNDRENQRSREETSRVNACTANGGSWTTIGGGTDKTCVMLMMEVAK